jgi:hypothetical protein
MYLPHESCVFWLTFLSTVIFKLVLAREWCTLVTLALGIPELQSALAWAVRNFLISIQFV